MTLVAFAIIICALVGLGCYIGVKVAESCVYLKYKDQKAWVGK